MTRRPGLRHVALLPGKARLVAFEFNTEQTYLLVLTDRLLQVFMGDVLAAQLAAPWTEGMLDHIAYTQSADTLLVVHPDLPPQRISRSSHTAWSIAGWSFVEQPFHRFAPPEATLASSATTGVVTLTASADVFRPGHANTLLRIGLKKLLVTQVISPTTVVATVQQPLMAPPPLPIGTRPPSAPRAAGRSPFASTRTGW
ncbi:hypothetical protein ACFQU7_11815 [Pseudoroseomonas wenyumeiae]